MSSINERAVARGRRVWPERDLAEAAADFYLLETLAARGEAEAEGRLDRLERRLAAEFASYLDCAIGGELRYAKRFVGERLPGELACFFREITPSERGRAWLTWTVVRRALGPKALELAEEVFEMPGWTRNFGGDAWAQVARLLRRHVEGEISPRIFVDQVLSIEHNTGHVLNKIYSISGLPVVLEAHGRDDYPALLCRASEETKHLWRLHEFRKRAGHDPIWLGVQILDTEEEPSRGEEER